MPLITVFTPTYNRSRKLHRVFHSLLKQTFRDFEWIIVDDGSTDDTKNVIDDFNRQNPFFLIKYFYQQNQGKHVAINKGVEMASGEWFYIADSDDEIVPGILQIFMEAWNTIPTNDQSSFSGIVACCKDQHGVRVSDAIPVSGYDGNWRDLFYKKKFRREATNINRLEIMKEFPFPASFPNIYFPEAIIWRKMSDKYKFRLINDELRIYYTEYDDMHSLMRTKKTYSDKALSACLESSDVLNKDLSYFFDFPSYFIKMAIVYHGYKPFIKAGDRLAVSLNKNASIFAAIFIFPGMVCNMVFNAKDKKVLKSNNEQYI